MPIDIPRVSIRDQDRLVASVPGPSLLYAADGTGGSSSSLSNLVGSLPMVAANEVVEISLPTVASLLPVVSLPTVAAEILLVVSLPTEATNEVAEISLPPFPSSGSKSTHGSNHNSGSKPTYCSNRNPSAIYNTRHHFWFGWKLI